MFRLLNKYEENGKIVQEYTKDGETVSHRIETIKPDGDFIPAETPTLVEQIYAENLYQTALLEIQSLGGM